MKTLIANVRIRKQDRNGNTRHDVQLIDAESGDTIKRVEKVYGYGSHFKQTTEELINDHLPELAAKIAEHKAGPNKYKNWKESGIVNLIYIEHHY